MRNRILLVVSAFIILLLAGGFYLFRLSGNGDETATTSDVPKVIPDKKIVVKKDSPILLSTPATGPEALTFFLLIPAGIIGWNLRKHSHS